MKKICIIVSAFIIIYIVNNLYKKTKHYKGFTMQIDVLKKHVRNELEIVNFGSMYSRYAFTYDFIGYKGFNFGFESQYLYYTKRMIDQYSVNLKKGCIVLIGLSTCVFMKEGKKEYGGEERYYYFLNKKYLEKYNVLKKMFFTKFPILIHPKRIKYIVKDVDFSNYIEASVSINKNNKTEVQNLANERIQSWSKQFNFMNTYSEVDKGNIKNEIDKSTELLKEIIECCITKGFRPVIVIPPVSDSQRKLLGKNFLNSIFYEPMLKANIYQIPVLDYFKNPNFASHTLYFNSDCLNKEGRKRFTNVVLEDLSKINYL